MTDQDRANKIKNAVSALTAAIDEGAQAGLRTDLRVLPVETLGRLTTYSITASVSKPL